MQSLSNTQVDVLLSLWNGEEWLPELLNSLAQQTHQNFRLIVRDDGSSDESVNLVKSHARLSSKVELIDKNGGNIGPAASFLRLLQFSNAPLFMFCDQDDIWQSEKIESAVKCLTTANEKIDSTVPKLQFTDAALIHADGSLIHPSFLEKQRYNWPACGSMQKILISNPVIGATLAGNEALRTLVTHRSVETSMIAMHDWWLALIASTLGEVLLDERPLLLYRQHNENAIGSPNSTTKAYLARGLSRKRIQEVSDHLNRTYQQTGEFLRRYGRELNQHQLAQVEAVAKVSRSRFSSLALLRCFAMGVRPNTLVKTVAQLGAHFLADIYGLKGSKWL